MSNLLTDNTFSPDIKEILSKLFQFQINESSFDLQSISDCIEDLFEKLNNEDIGDIIAEAVNENLISQEQGERFLNISIWCGSTNGSQLHMTIENWLEQTTDPIRIQLALALDTFPFKSFEKMEKVLFSIAHRYPQFSELIKEVIQRRKAQGV